MKEIIEIHLAKLTNGAHFEFMTTVSKRAKAENAITSNAVAKAALGALQSALDEEDRCLVLSRKSLFTDDIEVADKERDKLFSGYRAAVKGFLHMPVADVAAAAKVLEQHLKDYRIDPQMQLDRETGLIANLIADCEEKYAAEVTKLGITPYVTALKAANEKVRTLIESRTNENAGGVAGELRMARRQSDEVYRKFVRTVNAVAILGAVGALDEFIDYVNEVIRRYKKGAKKNSGEGGIGQHGN